MYVVTYRASTGALDSTRSRSIVRLRVRWTAHALDLSCVYGCAGQHKLSIYRASTGALDSTRSRSM